MADDDFDLKDVKFGAPEFPKDPEPKKTTAKKTTSTRGPGRPSKASKHDEVFNEIKSMLFVLNLGFGMRDMHPEIGMRDGQEIIVGYYSCFNVYVQITSRGKPELTTEGTAFCEALANIVEDSPFLMKMLNGGDNIGKWMQLGMALYPLGQTIASNHLPQRMRDGVHPTN